MSTLRENILNRPIDTVLEDRVNNKAIDNIALNLRIEAGRLNSIANMLDGKLPFEDSNWSLALIAV